MNNFEREHRYQVFKIKNLQDCERDLLQSINDELAADGNAVKECVVVERDWPCYEATWKMVEQLANGQFVDPFATIAALHQKLDYANRCIDKLRKQQD